MMSNGEIQELVIEWTRAEILKDTLRAVLLRDKLESALADTIPQGAGRAIEYLKYIESVGSLTYTQYIQNNPTPETTAYQTSDSPEPF